MQAPTVISKTPIQGDAQAHARTTTILPQNTR